MSLSDSLLAIIPAPRARQGRGYIFPERRMNSGTGANTRDFQLGIDGFTFHDLYKPAKLAELDAKFRAQLKARDGALSARFEEYRGGAAFSPVDESNLIVAVAAHLGNFVGELFKVQAQREKLFELKAKGYKSIALAKAE